MRASAIAKRPLASLAALTLLAAVLVAVPSRSAHAATPLAWDMMTSTAQNLTSFTNPYDEVYTSAGDGFQKYQRGVSPSIPFAVLDDSLVTFPGDTAGIVDDNNLDEFFGVVDTVNGDPPPDEVAATWVFDVSTATSDLGLSIDMGAMGDFESSDFFEWTYQFDSGSVETAFASSVDEAGSLAYTLAGGHVETLNDPMLANGVLLNNVLTPQTKFLPGSSGASTLTITLTALFDGGSEAVAFQNLIVLDGFDPPLAINCGAPITTKQGIAATATITALDENDTSTITLASDDLGGGLSVAAQTGGASGETALLPITVAGTVPAGDYTASFSATNGSDVETCDLAITVNPPAPAATIAEIQGSGTFSPMVGDVVRTSGILTLIDSSGTDAWIQMGDGEDGDPATSDGIIIDDFQNIEPAPAIGDYIIIEGQVEEPDFGDNSQPRTRIDDTELIQNLGPAAALDPPLTITPVALTDLPNELLSEGIDFWEALEGMVVEVHDAVVVAPRSGFGEFAMLTPTDAVAGSGFFSSLSQILLRDLGGNVVDYNPERILVDDDGALDTPNVAPGDTVNHLIGVGDYTFGAYKLQIIEVDATIAPTPAAPVSVRAPDSGGSDGTGAVITTFNVENLFDLYDNPNKPDESSTPSAAELETHLTKLALAIRDELLLPEIIVLQEVENTFITQVLGDRVNAANGTDYIATSFEVSDARGIEVAFLWDANRVSLLEAFQLSGADVEAAFGDSSASRGRQPLYGKFQIGGDVVHIVGNHFKSKGGDDPPFGLNDPFIRITEVQRKLQAQVVRDFVDGLLASDPGALVMAVGDLNDFAFGEPGEGTDHPVAILEGAGGGAPLTNLIGMEPADDQWSFIFDGNSQVLDHMLVNDALLSKMVGGDFLHFNAAFPSGLEADDSTSTRASDHDPFEGRFEFAKGDSGGGDAADGLARFSTFNASLNRSNAGDLITDLTSPDNVQAATVAEIIQRTRPDVLLINEFDYDAGGVAAELFQDRYLSVAQGDALPIHYPYRYVAPSNTGIPSGFDLNNNGSVGGPDDAFGFGFFEGQYAFVVYSMYPIDEANIRTFQNFLWKDMPGALLPDDPDIAGPADWYSPEELDVFRLSSKNHVDVPIKVGRRMVHFLVSHPTPPVFDGAEDRNGTRNHDEIRFWADYVHPGRSGYIYDDSGTFGGLGAQDLFVIAGDQNSDPFDGDSIPGSIQQLLDHPKVNTKVTPSSLGGTEQALLQGLNNDLHLSDPAFDTADFRDDRPFDPANLRADYVLPRKNMQLVDAGVFWPLESDPLFSLVGTFPFPSSDHRLVWIDIDTRSMSRGGGNRGHR
ncbi:MAG: endonuclease/exonuclease/phosphatase family protein [Acidimicrobiia bacterium]|nr:endonuclease/exonuclease/phosphatase family protein [Acidimicrobiia bacterium]